MEISDILRHTWRGECLGCAIATGAMIPPGGMIAENMSCYVHHDPEIPIVGFLVIGSKRHLHSMTEYTREEYHDFSTMLLSSRKVLNNLPDIRSVTVIQEERSSHFHAWLFPWYEWMIAHAGRISLTHIRTVMQEARYTRNTPEQIQRILQSVALLRSMIE